jgi:hypothetical protein
VTIILRGTDAVNSGKAAGALSHAEGTGQTTTGGAQAHAEGSGSSAGAQGAHAEGSSTATASNAHAEGSATQATGSGAHSEGSGSVASGNNSHAEGSSTTASGSSAHSEGANTTASGTNSHAEGAGAVASRVAQHAKASSFFNSSGDTQYSNYVAMCFTTDATPTPLLSGNSGLVNTSGTNTNVLTLTVSRAMYFRFECLARRYDTIGESSAWTIVGALVRDVSGVPRFLGAPTTTVYADAGAAAWTLVPSIVTLAGPVYYLALTGTGEAAKSIRWAATLHTTECG